MSSIIFHKHDQFRLRPSRITCTSSKLQSKSSYATAMDMYIRRLEQEVDRKLNQPKPITQNRLIKKTDYSLSRTTQNAIKESIELMYMLAPKRKISLKNGKTIPKFKCSFVTLTLPSAQVHSDVEIKTLLNNFFSTLRFHGLKNYVWKLEFQKNGNIHFHCVLDKFFTFYYIRALWNKNLEKLGYISAYQTKFKGISYEHYKTIHRENELRNASKNTTPDNILRMRYNSGCQTNWTCPNTVDVQNIKSSKQLVHYLSKYVSKDLRDNSYDDCNGPLNATDLERVQNLGKVWGRSHSISAVKFNATFDDVLLSEFKEYVSMYPDAFYIVEYDYCSCIYLSSEWMPPPLRKLIFEIHCQNAIHFGYTFAN